MRRCLRICIQLLSSVFVLLVCNACGSSGTGFNTLAGFCAGSNCAAGTATGASVFLSNQGFTIPKALSFFSACSMGQSAFSATGPYASPTVSVICGGGDYATPPTIPGGWYFATSLLSDINNGVASSNYIYKQQYPVSGMCSTGGAAASKITFQVSTGGPFCSGNGVTCYPQDMYGKNYVQTYSTTCDSGRFTFILTPPLFPGNLAAGYMGLTSPAINLVVSLYTGTSLASINPAIQAPVSQVATVFYVNY